MNLSLDHEDITSAIEAYVTNQGIQVTGKTLVTTITCGRGPNGASATVELVRNDTIAAGPEQGAVVPGRKVRELKPAPEPTQEKQTPAPETSSFQDNDSELFGESSAEESLPAASAGGGLFDE